MKASKTISAYFPSKRNKQGTFIQTQQRMVRRVWLRGELLPLLGVQVRLTFKGGIVLEGKLLSCTPALIVNVLTDEGRTFLASATNLESWMPRYEPN